MDTIEEEEQEEDSIHQGSRNQQNSETVIPSPRSDQERIFYNDYKAYESIDRKHGPRKDEVSSRRRNNRPPIDLGVFDLKEANRREESEDNVEPREATTSTRYRETSFHVRPNDYEHELDDEEYLKPRPRKRRPPQNYEFGLVENETTKTELNGSWSRSSVQKDSSESTESRGQHAKNAMELKSLLKMQQEEGLSLSELLQRRNLTLNDLLRGRADVINALRSKDTETDDHIDVRSSTTRKPHRSSTEAIRLKDSTKGEIVSVVTVAPVLHKNAPVYLDTSTTGKSIDKDHPRLAGKWTPGLPTVVATSIPVPTNSMESPQNDQAVRSRNYGGTKAAEVLEEDEIMEFSDFTDYKNGRNAMSPVWLTARDEQGDLVSPELFKESNENRGSTLSIEQLLTPTERSKLGTDERMHVDDTGAIEQPELEDYTAFMEQEYQDDASATYQDQNAGVTIPTNKDTTRESVLDTISHWDSTKEQRTTPNDAGHQSLGDHQTTNRTDKKHREDDDVSEVEPEARAEIFELFASGSAGKRLERLLKSRNMSLDELIALRQRGSSKVHLAEVSRIRVQKFDAKKSETVSSSVQGNSIGEGRAINNGPNDYNERINGYLTEHYESTTGSVPNPVNFIQPEESTTTVSSSTTSRIMNTNDEQREIEERRTLQIVDLLTTFDSLPFAKDIQRNVAGERDNEEERRKLSEQSEDRGVVFVDDRETVRDNDTANTIQSGFVKKIIEQKPGSVDIRVVYSETDVFNEDDHKNERGRALSKIRPNIIASGAILGVTIVVFLAIFITCKIKQKQKYRYRNTFSRAVFQGPALTARKLSNSSSLSTVMVNVVATSTTKRPEKNDVAAHAGDMDSKSDIDNDSLDANDSWETIPDYMK
ncbi:hypothetical protein WN55_08725 [Dufourea novaeangliae]|uniref:Uncharacterized protein n=1 Tax=Dufourea novaeangliae TaxID=178035 RepID=A0A154P1K8_DUFNO|nr:hypothetical protein WN55_08725 [Dufourea novaeangliae]